MLSHTYYIHDFLAHKDTNALNILIDNIYARCKGIAQRYCKTDEQAKNLSHACFLNALKTILNSKQQEFTDRDFIKQFVICLAKSILEQRKGELIADTTIVSVFKKSEANLFSNSEYYRMLQPAELIQHLRKLNDIQQIIFNMIVIDGYSVSEAADILQHNELSIKALIEKAKFNLISSIKSTV